ncbi:MAG: NADH:ubiquinone reductase (Na(+)-transporting) subunit B [Cyclobacteriaceae bacterium]|nr:NADH:ubiquinone reductase (Na(+)-transporting) subunit B [Cyclobacteriaceae bacterium]
MKFVKDILDKQRPMFQKGGRFEKFYYLFEAGETFMFTPDHTTDSKGAQIRDAVDLKRLMMTVVIAMIPCLIYGMWNVGHQHFIATGEVASLGQKLWVGVYVVLPMLLVSYGAGGLVEVIFGIIRKHPINEGFLVTGMLIPLVLPPTTPLWQIALGTIFAVVIAKEAFGGTGMNVLNIAMTARAFLYFAYPAQMSGENVWTYLGDATPVEGYSGATSLAVAYNASVEGTHTVVAAMGDSWYANLYDFKNLFLGAIPGSVGETSVLMALIGAAILIVTEVGSWKIIFSVFGGALFMGYLFNLFGLNAFMEMPPHYHLVIGGLAFGAVFMATDPVTAAHTERGKWIYGFLIGVLTVLIRVVNPAYPEGIMLAVLLMNVFAPLIDFYVVQANKKRRLKRATI